MKCEFSMQRTLHLGKSLGFFTTARSVEFADRMELQKPKFLIERLRNEVQ